MRCSNRRSHGGHVRGLGILAALRAREKTGRGQRVDVSMFDGQLGLLHWTIGSYLANGVVPEPMGTARTALFPYQTFRTKTRDLALAVGSDKLWRTFCPLLGLEDMMDDARYVTSAARVANHVTLIGRLQGIFLTKTYEAWEAILVPAGIPMGAINTIDKVVEHPQVRERGMIIAHEHPIAGEIKMVGVPLKLSETPGSVRLPAPTLGQHTNEVLREVLGLDDTEISALRVTGAIGGAREA